MEEGKYYHIYNRGNNREEIFKEEENYRFFISKYEKYLSEYVETFAYCLMPNHFHFLVRIKDNATRLKQTKFKVSQLTPVEKAFKDFFISYAKSINKRYNRVGSLFQYKIKRKEVDNEDYLRKLIIYIHNNPLEAGLCGDLKDWRYSSYNMVKEQRSSALLNCEALDWFENEENFEHCHKTNAEIESDW